MFTRFQNIVRSGAAGARPRTTVTALHTAANILVFPVADYFVVTNGGHAWAFGDLFEAFQDAQWLAANTGKPLRAIFKDKSSNEKF